MRVASSWPWLWLVGGAAVVVPLVGIASIPFWAPTLAAAACPSCYGMQRIAERLFVDAGMPEDRRRELQISISTAESMVVAFFGSLSPRRTILACGDDACEDRLRGRLEGSARVRAFTYAGPFSVIRLSPRGQSATIVAHELSHAQVHARTGFLNHMRGSFPAWFDEGLAVLISEDRRYFRPGQSAAERCLPTPDGDPPRLRCRGTQRSAQRHGSTPKPHAT
jgi:hypothetical protein